MVSRRETKVLLPEGETGAQRKKPPLSASGKLLLHDACSEQGKTTMESVQTISPVCCHSHALPHLIVISRAPLQPWARLCSFQYDRERPWEESAVRSGHIVNNEEKT